MKKFSVFFILLAFLMTVSCFFGFKEKNVYAIEDKIIDSKSKAALLMDADTGTVIFKNNENDKRPIASMCKIMTLNLCFDAVEEGELSLSDKIFVSEAAAGMGGSQVFLEANAEYLVEELLKSIVVASANDACVAMAERICGSEEIFVDKMNNKAKELGMNDTCFTNCTGLPKPGQYSCAKDVAKMFAELLRHKDYFKFSKIWTDKIEHPENRVTEIANTNKLVRFYNGCDGGKTGYTAEAGHCLSASAFRDGTRYIAVVIGAPDSKTRFNEVSTMFNYGFANYSTKKIVDENQPLNLTVSVIGGKKDSLRVIAEKPIFLFMKKNEKKAVEINFEPLNIVKAPVRKGDIVGNLCVYENGEQLNSVRVIALEDIAENTYFDVIFDVIDNWALID